MAWVAGGWSSRAPVRKARLQAAEGVAAGLELLLRPQQHLRQVVLLAVGDAGVLVPLDVVQATSDIIDLSL